jgi:hypothetical protein
VEAGRGLDLGGLDARLPPDFELERELGFESGARIGASTA